MLLFFYYCIVINLIVCGSRRDHRDLWRRYIGQTVANRGPRRQYGGHDLIQSSCCRINPGKSINKQNKFMKFVNYVHIHIKNSKNNLFFSFWKHLICIPHLYFMLYINTNSNFTKDYYNNKTILYTIQNLFFFFFQYFLSSLRPNMCSDTFFPQINEKTQYLWPIQHKAMRFPRHTLAPSTGRHDLTTEMQFKEKFIDQRGQRIVRQETQCNGHFIIGTVNVQFERNKVLRLSHGL